MAMFTMWIAYISSACGFHAAVFCHTVLPLFLIPLTELVYLETGRRLLNGRDGTGRELLPVFMIFVMLLQMFGSVSIYTSETFFLTRTWQGKSMVANFLFPMMLLIWMEILGIGRDESDADKTAGTEDAAPCENVSFWWAMLFLLSSCAGIFSSLAVVLCSAFSVLIAVMFAVRRHSMRLMVNTLIALIPAVIYVAVYILI